MKPKNLLAIYESRLFFTRLRESPDFQKAIDLLKLKIGENFKSELSDLVSDLTVLLTGDSSVYRFADAFNRYMQNYKDYNIEDLGLYFRTLLYDFNIQLMTKKSVNNNINNIYEPPKWVKELFKKHREKLRISLSEEDTEQD